MQIAAFWEVKPYCLALICPCFELTLCLQLQGVLQSKDTVNSSNTSQIYIRVHGIKSEKAGIFILTNVSTSNLANQE
jgi:hypothetical protein